MIVYLFLLCKITVIYSFLPYPNGYDCEHTVKNTHLGTGFLIKETPGITAESFHPCMNIFVFKYISLYH